MDTPTDAIINNVRLFDGDGLTEPRSLFIRDGVIAGAAPGDGAGTYDGAGGTLLPGLIDSHVHVLSEDDLTQAVRRGVTTVLDMASASAPRLRAMRRPGRPDLRTAGIPASARGGTQTTKMGFPESSIVTGPADAARFVAERASDGVDYIKVIAENPRVMGPAALDGPTIAALARAAHGLGFKIIAHATSLPAIQLAADACVDVITHAPLDGPAGDALVELMARTGIIAVPTLTMMRTVAGRAAQMPTHQGTVPDYANARATVAAFHQAGVLILAGTDANMAGGSPMKVPFGESLQDELGLLVEAGLTPAEALRSATVLPARYFGLFDRGSLEAGRRADLLLVDGDPTQDVAAVRAVRAVWAAGVRVREDS